mmetsp:Transcript_3907/g.4800  ORF Transcript_3907/g.4800 Transcript_3907/m.4800 type:complete len:784 (-) Transcript_3907:91-2442(-)
MPSITNLDSMEGDIDSPTMRKPQQHRPQDQDEVDTDIETPLSSPERETASTTGSGSANLTVSTTLPSTSMSTDITPTARNGSGSAGKTTESKGNGNGNRKDALPALELNSSRSNDCVDGQEEDEVQDYSNWPLRDIKDPHGNDVLYGRGGGTNHHPGNKRYRKLVEGRKVDYVNSKRLDKPLVALEIIKEWRTQVPPGRFLKIDEDTGFWHDVGDRKAREKTSQALREKAPLLRKQQEEQRKEKLSTQKESSKNTRFDVPDKKSKVSKNLTRVMLARDHSLGRDYIPADEPVSVKGFSWTAPVLDVDAKSEEAPKLADWENPPKSSGSWEDRLDSDPTTATAYDVHGPRSVPVSVSVSGPTPSVQVQSSPTSHPYLGTSGGDYSQPSSSQDAMPPPSYSTNWQQVQHNPHTPKSSQTIMNEWRGFQSEDLARKNYSGVEQDYRHSRSADDAFRRTSKRGYYGTNSDNSHLQSGDYERFANIVGSNTGHPNYMHSWTSASTPNRSNSDGMYKPPDVVYDTSRRSNSSGMYDASSYHSPDRMSIRNSYRMEESWASPQPHATHSQTSPQSSIDYYNHGHPAYRPPPTTTTAESFLHDPNASHMITSPNPNTCIPRPPNVKRDTSHKMETMDVEPTTKRMNRQVSIGHRSSSMSSVDEVTEKDIKHLNSSLEQSSLAGDDETNEAPFHNSQHSRRPQSLKESDRVTTIDRFVVDLDGKSSMLDMGLKEEEENGAEQPGSEGSSININIKEVLTTTRPAPLSGDDRISTLGTIDSDLFSGLTNAAPV